MITCRINVDFVRLELGLASMICATIRLGFEFRSRLALILTLMPINPPNISVSRTRRLDVGT